MDLEGMLQNGIDTFLPVLVRMTGLFVITPVFGRRNVPSYMKIGFALYMALILTTTFNPGSLEYDRFFEYAMIVIKEFAVGLVLGYIAYIVLNAIYVAGQIIDMQIGFGMVNVIDPMSNIQVPISANFYYIISILVLLMIRGHHVIIKALFDSYKYVPLGKASLNGRLLDDMLRIFGNVFIIGFRIAAPVTAAVLVVNVALGVMSKAVPQLNVFVLGMPLKILLGIMVMLATIPVFMDMLNSLFGNMGGEMTNFLRDMVP